MLPDGEVQSTGSVVVVRSAPHREVLPQTSVLVTHCGHGTTMKALAAGVPMVCMPMGRDQDDTAARVVHAGAGLRIKPKSGPETIARAVTRLLNDDRFRSNARRLRDAMAGELRSIDIAAALEKIGAGSIERREIELVATPAAAPF